jgi:site-specific DNA-cytosine methylase
MLNNLAKEQRRTMIGNAVTVPVIEELGLRLLIGNNRS